MGIQIQNRRLRLGEAEPEVPRLVLGPGELDQGEPGSLPSDVEFADSKRAPEDQPAGSVAADYMENAGFEEIDGEDGELPF